MLILCSNNPSARLQQSSTENFQTHKLNLERTEESKLPALTGSQKMQGNSEKIYFSFIDYTKAFDCVDHNTLWKILTKKQEY